MPIIQPLFGPGATAPRRAASGGGGFSLPVESHGAARAMIPRGTVSLSALIALQSEDEPVEDREARRHGQDVLAELAALHKALLGDTNGLRDLRSLAALAAAPPAPARDPRLDEAVAAIRLRARVELARYSAE